MKKFFKKIWIGLKDFFNPKDWIKTLRSVPAMALALITVATVLMNILANKSIIEIPRLGDGDYWLVQDAGIILSWVGFLVGDLMVKNFGSKHAIRVNLTCLSISLFISGLLVAAGSIPGTWSASYDYAGQVNEALNATMGNVWYVILGSALASAVGLIVNGVTQGLLLKKIESKHGDKYWGFLLASAGSTMIGQFIDNFVFASVVSVPFFGWTWFSVFACSFFGMIIELIFELVFSPLTYKISKNWQKNHIGDYWMTEQGKLENAEYIISQTVMTNLISETKMSEINEDESIDNRDK